MVPNTDAGLAKRDDYPVYK